MNPSDDRLSEALRELAAASPQGAGPEVRGRVRAAFLRHRSRRRQKQFAFVVGLAACLLLAFALLRPGKPTQPVTAAKATPQTQPAATSPPIETRSAKVTAAKTPDVLAKGRGRARKTGRDHGSKRPEPQAVMAASDFVALPTFDPSIPTGPSRMVRLDLSGSALQLIGYPVNEELLERRVLTDVLVGQDGMPYAVRLVQTSH
jgi:hypothetical protein